MPKTTSFDALDRDLSDASAPAARSWTGTLKQITAEVDAAQKKYDDSLAELERLKTQYKDSEETYFTLHEQYPWILGKKILTLPILDAFNSPRKIENLWSDGLTQDYTASATSAASTAARPAISRWQRRCPGSRRRRLTSSEETLELVVIPPAEGRAAQAAAR